MAQHSTAPRCSALQAALATSYSHNKPQPELWERCRRPRWDRSCSPAPGTPQLQPLGQRGASPARARGRGSGASDALVMSRRWPGRWCRVGSTQRGVRSQSRAGGSGGAELTPAPCVERGLQEVVEGSGTPNLAVGHHQIAQQDTTGTTTAHPWLCWARRQRGAGGMQQGRTQPQKGTPTSAPGVRRAGARISSQEPPCLRRELPGAGLCAEGVTNNQAKGRLNFLVIFSPAPWTVLLAPGYVATASAGKGWGP